MSSHRIVNPQTLLRAIHSADARLNVHVSIDCIRIELPAFQKIAET